MHYHLNFGALAALKRKRKKFSNSRNETPVLEPPPDNSTTTTASSLKKSIKKVTIEVCNKFLSFYNNTFFFYIYKI